MSLNLSGADLIGLGKLLTQTASATAAAKPATSSTSIRDLLTTAVSSNSTSYVKSSLTRGEALGTPTPLVPMITLEEFINQLVVALAELFRARGYERIADYLLTQHDLDAVFGQLATRMLAIYNQSQRRQSLIQKYLRVNSGVANLLTESQQDLTFNDTPDNVLTMSSYQLNQLNQLLNGYSDSTGNHIGLSGIASQATSAVINAPITALQTAASAGELLDPTDALVKSGINTAASLAQQVKTQLGTSNPQFALITNSANNTSGLNDTTTLASTSQSLLASDYTKSSTVNALSDLNSIVSGATSGATSPLFPPLYQSGTSYSWNAFVTYGYQVYQCTNQNGSSGSPVSDPNSWTSTGLYPAGSAYQMNKLTSVASSDVSYMQKYGEVNFVSGQNYITAQNVLYNNSPYYATQNLNYDALQAGTFPSNDAVTYQNSAYLNTSGNNFTITQLNSGTSYKKGDVVAFKGNFYIATADGTYYPQAINFDTYRSYSNGDCVIDNNILYKAIASTGYANFNQDNFSYSSPPSSSGLGKGNGPISKYKIPDGMYANITYSDDKQTTAKLTGSVDYSNNQKYFLDRSYPEVGYYYNSSDNGGLGRIDVTFINDDHVSCFLQYKIGNDTTPDSCYGKISFDFDFNLNNQNSDGISISYAHPDKPTELHGNGVGGDGFVNGAGRTGVCICFDTINSNYGDQPYKAAIYRYDGVDCNTKVNSGRAFNFYQALVGTSGNISGLIAGTCHCSVTIADSKMSVSVRDAYGNVNNASANLDYTGQNSHAWNPDHNWTIVFGSSDGSKHSEHDIRNFKHTFYDANIATIDNVGVTVPSQNSTIFSSLGTGAQALAPDAAGSNFSSYSPANDTANWATYSPSTDTMRWTSGASPTLLAKQTELQTILPALKSLFDTTNFTPGLRQDLLDLCQSSANQTTFPVIQTFYPQMVSFMTYQQYAALFTTWTNQLNQSGPNYSAVKSSAQGMLNQINSQIQQSSLADGNQFWAQIKTQLSALINACNSSNQSSALTAIGPLAPTPDNDPNGTSLVSLIFNQYTQLNDISAQWDFITNHIPLSGVIDISDSPLAAMIDQIQILQGYITRIQQGDTSIPRAQFFNLMKNTLENVYDYQPLTDTAVFSQSDYAADQSLLAQAMLIKGGGGIAVNKSLQAAEDLGVTDALGSTLIGLYRDIYQATGNTGGVNQINAFLASQSPPTTGFNGYLRQGSDALSTFANDAGSGLNTTVEALGMNRKKHSTLFKTFNLSRKATKDGGWLTLKKDYDQYKGFVPAALQGVNTDLLFAADQYVGDNYVAGTKSQITQRVYYNGQFYKAISSSYDSPPAGVNNRTWELMNWNPNRSSQYVFGDIVTTNGLKYRCLNDHQPTSDLSVTPGNVRARNTWACLDFQSGYTYLPGDTVLVASNDATKPFIPYVALIKYTSGGSSDLSNASLWQRGYNNAVTLNGGTPNPAATLGGVTAVVNGSNSRFDPNITSQQIYSNYGGNVSVGTIFSTLLNAQNAATSSPFYGWSDVSNQNIDTNTTTARTSGGTATTYDGMQFFNPALSLATQVMQTLQMIDLFFYAHQKFTISGGGNYYSGYTSPINALTFGAADGAGVNAYKVTFAGQATSFESTATRHIYQVYADHNMGDTFNNGWANGQFNAHNNFYSAARALAGQLKSQVNSFQNNYNNMIFAVQKESYRLLAQSFINTIDLEASLKRLFRNAPLSDDEKKLLAKILAAILSLLVAILGSDPRIQDAFTTQSVSSLSATKSKVTQTQWKFNTALSGVTIAQSFANDIIAKAIALANEMLSEKARGSSITSDRLTTQNYLNMNALIKGQQEALEHLDAKTSAGTTYV